MITAIIWLLFTSIFLGALLLMCAWAENTKLGHKFIRGIGKLFFDIDVDELED